MSPRRAPSPEDVLIENSAAGLVMLPPDRDVTVTREQYHQAALSPFSPRTRGHRRSVAVELGVCRIGSGKYAGGRGIEVRLDGRRIGELTHNMSERYLPLVDHIIANSGRPGCEAVIRQGDRGIEVELRLPDLRERHRQVPPARPAPLGPPPPVRPPVWGAPQPPPAIPMPARSHVGRFRLGWITGSVVALLLVVGALADDDPQPSIPPAASAAAPSTTNAEAPRTRTEATESGSGAQQSTARPSSTPTATPSTTRTEAAPSTRTTRTPAPSDDEPTSSRSGDSCDPNYSGACVPIASDVDCAGGSGNGPAYVSGPVRVVGSDKYKLDRDGDGTACDS